MKIAICYSGNLRTFAHCVKNHAEIIKEADVYFSTWDNIKFSNHDNDPWHTRITIPSPEIVTENYIVNNTPSNFTIKNIKIDNEKDCVIKDIKQHKYLSYQYFKIWDAYQLIVNSHNNYDYIIRLRPDITIDSMVYIPNKIVVNNYVWYNFEYIETNKMMNEMLWVSDMNRMQKSVNIYNNLIELGKNLTKEKTFGESIYFANLEHEELLKDLYVHNFNYRVIR